MQFYGVSKSKLEVDSEVTLGIDGFLHNTDSPDSIGKVLSCKPHSAVDQWKIEYDAYIPSTSLNEVSLSGMEFKMSADLKVTR